MLFKYLLYFSISCGNQYISKNVVSANRYKFHKLLLLKIKQTLGVETKVYLNENNILSLYQTDLFKKNIATLRFSNPNKKEEFCFFEKFKKTGNLKLKTFIKSKGDNLIVESTRDNVKKTFKTPNIYLFLKEVKEININLNYIPDYFFLSNEIPNLNSDNNKFHKVFYSMYGINQKYNEYVYICDTKTYSMGDMLTKFGTPAQILWSGDGQETLIYVGLHKCKKNKENIFFALMICQCNLYGKVIKLFYSIPLCPVCHVNVHMDTTKLQV